MEVTRIEGWQRSFIAGEIRKHKDYHIAYFNKRPLWLLLRNIYYNESMQDKFPNEHYKSSQQVPIYSIVKNHRKVGIFFPRTAEETGNDFLYCPKNKDIKKDYYIWDLEDKHSVRDYAKIHRML